MKRFIALAFSLWLPVLALAASPATTLTGSTVESVDEAKQTISIKTKDGQSYTLKVQDPELLKKYNLKKGDQISLQVDTNNNVIQIAKSDTQTN
jgi:hypothetical protein